MQTIELGNHSYERANRLVEKLNGQSFMNFQVHAAPFSGSWHVWAETNYDASANEVTEMMLFVMAVELSR